MKQLIDRQKYLQQTLLIAQLCLYPLSLIIAEHFEVINAALNLLLYLLEIILY